MTKRARQSGLTLVELIVTIVIIGIALGGIIMALVSGISRSTDTLIETRAAALAASYLEEILAKRFDENASVTGIPPCWNDCSPESAFGPDPGETGRQSWDDVDDYHNLSEGEGQAEPLRDATGRLRRGYAGFRVSVTVRYLQPGVGGREQGLGAGAGGLTQAFDAKLITLTVHHPVLGDGLQFSAYKGNF